VHEVRLASTKAPPKKSEGLPKPVAEPPPPRTELEAAFDLLVEAAAKAKADEKSPRAANIKNIIRRLQKDFDEKALTNEKGEHFSNFTEFVRLAARRGYVDLSGKGIYLEIVPSGNKPERIATAKDTATADAAAASAAAAAAVPAAAELEPAPSVASGDAIPAHGEAVQEEGARQPFPSVQQQQNPDQPEVGTQLASTPEQIAPSPERNQNPAPQVLSDKLPNELEVDGIPISDVALPPGLEYRRRALVLDALRTCQYPAPAQQIAQHVKQVRDQRQFDLPDKRVYQLITLARDLGLIVAVDPEQSEQGSVYRFHDESEQVRAFIETPA
jgi:hypothetical protein